MLTFGIPVTQKRKIIQHFEASSNLVKMIGTHLSLKHSLKFKGKIWLDKLIVNIHFKFSTGFITQTITLVSR